MLQLAYLNNKQLKRKEVNKKQVESHKGNCFLMMQLLNRLMKKRISYFTGGALKEKVL